MRSAVLEAFTDADRRSAMTQSTNIFRVLIKTLLKAGIITERTRPVYAAWVDMDELARESDEVAGQDVADAAMVELREINRGRKKIGRASSGPSPPEDGQPLRSSPSRRPGRPRGAARLLGGSR